MPVNTVIDGILGRVCQYTVLNVLQVIKKVQHAELSFLYKSIFSKLSLTECSSTLELVARFYIIFVNAIALIIVKEKNTL